MNEKYQSMGDSYFLWNIGFHYAFFSFLPITHTLLYQSIWILLLIHFKKKYISHIFADVWNSNSFLLFLFTRILPFLFDVCFYRTELIKSHNDAGSLVSIITPIIFLSFQINLKEMEFNVKRRYFFESNLIKILVKTSF